MSDEELREAIETNDSGAIFISKPSATPRSKRALASADSLALDVENDDVDCVQCDDVDHDLEKSRPDGNDGDSETLDDDVVSLELLTVVDDEPEKNRMQGLCSKRMIWCWLCGLLLLILAIVLPLVLKKDDNDAYINTEDKDGIDFVSDGSVTTPAYEVLRPVVADPGKLLDPNTPEGQAYLAVRKEDDPFDIQQNYALQALYYSTDGEAWVFNHGWDSYSDTKTRSFDSPCAWASISVCRNAGDGKMAVAGLDLDSNNLKGSLPEDLCLLKELESLRVANNQLEGSVPSCLASNPNLTVLEVEGNEGLSKDAVSDPEFCDLFGKSWDSFVADCSMTCECCTSCV